MLGIVRAVAVAVALALVLIGWYEFREWRDAPKQDTKLVQIKKGEAVCMQDVVYADLRADEAAYIPALVSMLNFSEKWGVSLCGGIFNQALNTRAPSQPKRYLRKKIGMVGLLIWNSGHASHLKAGKMVSKVRIGDYGSYNLKTHPWLSKVTRYSRKRRLGNTDMELMRDEMCLVFTTKLGTEFFKPKTDGRCSE